MFAKFIVWKDFGGIASQQSQMRSHAIIIPLDELFVMLIPEWFIGADKHEVTEINGWTYVTGQLPIQEDNVGGMAVL